MGQILNVKDCIRERKDKLLFKVSIQAHGVNLSEWGYGMGITHNPTHHTLCGSSLRICPSKNRISCYCNESGVGWYKLVFNVTAWSFYSNGYLRAMMTYKDMSNIFSPQRIQYPVVTAPSKEWLKIGNVLYNKKALRRLNNSRLEISKEDVPLLFNVSGLTSPFEIRMSSLKKSESTVNQTTLTMILNLQSRFLDLYFKEHEHCRRQTVYKFLFLEEENEEEGPETVAVTNDKPIRTKSGKVLYLITFSVLGICLTFGLHN